MSSPINAILTGSFTSAGIVQNIPLESGYTNFEMLNITDFGSAAANTNVMTVSGTSLLPAGYALVGNKTSGSATIALPSMITSGGLTFVADSGNQTPQAQQTGSAISSAAPAVVSGTTVNVVPGSVVRMYNTPGIYQIAGVDFTVGTVTPATNFTLAYLDTTLTNLTAGTTSNYRVIPFNPRYYPVRRTITNMASSSVSTLITLSVTHGYTVGQLVRIYCPSNFGMTQINGLTATVTAVGTADTSGFTNTITVNINSSGFTAFGWPTSATAASGMQFAFVEPVGETATNSVSQPYGNLLDDATRNVSFTGVQVGTSAQTSGKLYQWTAYQGITLS
jgi:hypothetical protein